MRGASGRKNPAREPGPGTPEGDEIGDTGRQGAKGTSPIPAGSTGGPHIVNRQSFRQPVPVGEQLPEHGGMMAHGVPPEAHTAHERGDTMRGPNEVKQPVPTYRKQPDGPLPVPVYLVDRGVGSKALKTLATDKFTIPAAGSDPVRIAGRDKTRSHLCLLVETAAVTTQAVAQVPATVNQIPLAATGVASFSNNSAGVLQTISGGTVTVIAINGTTTGLTSGTFFVPAGGTVTVTYSVAPTTFTTAPSVAAVAGVTPAGIRIDHEVGNLTLGGGALLRAGAVSYFKMEFNDELFAVSADSSVCIVSVIFLYGVPGGG